MVTGGQTFLAPRAELQPPIGAAGKARGTPRVKANRAAASGFAQGAREQQCLEHWEQQCSGAAVLGTLGAAVLRSSSAWDCLCVHASRKGNIAALIEQLHGACALGACCTLCN